MIEIAAVQATGRELRPLQKGWGAMHWVAAAAMCVLPLGMICLFVLVSTYDPVFAPRNWAALLMVATLILWLVSQWILQSVILRQMQRSTAGGAALDWSLDEAGLTQTSALVSSRIDWAAVRDVLEEKDRFVLLVTPYNNPVLPKRQMTAEQIEAFKALLARVRTSGRLGRGVD